MHVDGDAAAVVLDPDAPSASGVTSMASQYPGECLVDRVVHDFLHQMVEFALPGGADIHTRPFPDGFKALEYRD